MLILSILSIVLLLFADAELVEEVLMNLWQDALDRADKSFT